MVVAMAPWTKILELALIFSPESHRAKTGGEVCDQIVSKESGSKEGLLDLVVEAKLPDCHQDCPGSDSVMGLCYTDTQLKQETGHRRNCRSSLFQT